jgi:putative oligomerization/nucleic acid binding protein
MLFLYRPRQTWMPFSLPRNRTEQAAYNRQLQQKFDSTRRVPPAVPAVSPAPQQHDPIAELKDVAALHASGALTDAEFATAKANLLGR